MQSRRVVSSSDKRRPSVLPSDQEDAVLTSDRTEARTTGEHPCSAAFVPSAGRHLAMLPGAVRVPTSPGVIHDGRRRDGGNTPRLSRSSRLDRGVVTILPSPTPPDRSVSPPPIPGSGLCPLRQGTTCRPCRPTAAVITSQGCKRSLGLGSPAGRLTDRLRTRFCLRVSGSPRRRCGRGGQNCRSLRNRLGSRRELTYRSGRGG